MKKQLHQIRKETLQIAFHSEALAKVWLGNTAEFQAQYIEPFLAKVFDQCAPAKRIVRIPLIEITLGDVSVAAFGHALEEKLLASLTKLKFDLPEAENPTPVKGAASSANSIMPGIENPLDDAFQCFLYFLTYAALPWNSRFKSLRSLEKRLSLKFKQIKEPEIAQIKSSLNNPNARKRLHIQFNPTFAVLVYETVFQIKEPTFHAFKLEVFRLLQGYGAIPNRDQKMIEMEKLVFLPYFDLSEAAYTAYLVNPFQSYLLFEILPLLPHSIQELLRSVPVDSEQHYKHYLDRIHSYLEDYKQKQHASVEPGNRKDTNFRKPRTVKGKNKKKEQYSNKQVNGEPDTPAKSITNQPVLNESTSHTSKGQDAFAGQLPKYDITQGAIQKHLMAADADQKSAELLESSYYIENAGLILLWPYFKPLFEELNYVKDAVFNPASHHRAIHMLQFLVYGRDKPEEQLLILPKLLCGWNLERALPQKIKLTIAEKKESKAMLKQAIKHWQVLKNTSVAAFQTSFLQRKGGLYQEDSCWKLVVAQKPYDMLLGHLPYSIAIIKLKWMDKTLKTDWA